MGNSNTVKVVTLLIGFSVYGLVCWGQHMYCPPQDWTRGSTITLRCYVPRDDYPSKCTGGFSDKVTFTRESAEKCIVYDVNTTSCRSSKDECGCESPNATDFIVYHTFTVEDDDNGTWACTVVCLDGNALPPLPFSSANCDNRTVEEPPVPHGLTPGEIVAIVIACLLVVGAIIGVIIYCKIKKKCCFAETTEDGGERRNAMPMNDHGHEKPPNTNASDKPPNTHDTTMAEHDANRDGQP